MVDDLVLATIGLDVATSSLVLATLIYVYYIRKLAQHTASQLSAFQIQAAALGTQIATQAIVVQRTSGTHISREDIEEKRRELGLI